MSKKISGVYVITDTRLQTRYTHIELTEMAVEGGAAVIQFREKNMTPAAMLPIARRMQLICSENDVGCIVNDRVDLMLSAGSTGVHVGQEDLPINRIRKLVGDNYIIGGSASTLEEAQKVEESGADYIGFGHIFETRTKEKGYAPRGLELLNKVTNKVGIPVMAIGGINQENAEDVMKAGAAGFCVSSVVCTADDPRQVVQKLVQVYESGS